MHLFGTVMPFHRAAGCLALVASAALATAQPAPTAPRGPSEEAMRAFLAQGKWSTTADDNISGELLQADFIKTLVEAYETNPTDATAIANLSLIPLALAVAEWGVSPTTGLPKDPARRNWEAVESTGDGKHLMSYSKGGIGVMHQDSGGLEKLMGYLEKNHPDVVPAANKNEFFKLKGVNFDRLYASGGHCTSPLTEVKTDLAGAAFQHDEHPRFAGKKYCRDYFRSTLSPKDWQVFRHGMREALRREDVQFRIMRDFANNEWASAYRLVVTDGKHDVREAFILARIWNSSPRGARCAFGHAKGATGTAARIQKELEAYADDEICPKDGKERMVERWPYMRRAVLAYDAFAKKPPP
ncbi:hypothetical protein WDL1P1_00504 (plasmid) [Variovorax sp. WDL1]|nr:hypothetical protein CHC06_06072 [Variovorax sp. B2]PNG51321.1 hypothetical protein CHC07_05978 [Variovorax sp. B4]VTU43266.1 hypothetical protein H6P1_00402 [Variovorax sp. PBL-H6]VTU43332.1 hypothetical protein SRS16P1_00503 [Variovorax sp. SRS16]VTU43351.1 hypothetical protein E5P1_00499 [Variovorax sp. PBL-E5]VTV17583.1 hypothetical protein WDL1P1_00504 [Variovorax sp. WDL1]